MNLFFCPNETTDHRFGISINLLIGVSRVTCDLKSKTNRDCFSKQTPLKNKPL